MLYQVSDRLYPREYSTPEALLLYLQIPSRIMFIYLTLSTPFNTFKASDKQGGKFQLTDDGQWYSDSLWERHKGRLVMLDS